MGWGLCGGGERLACQVLSVARQPLRHLSVHSACRACAVLPHAICVAVRASSNHTNHHLDRTERGHCLQHQRRHHHSNRSALLSTLVEG
jgi:hypothetical protein